MLNRLVPQKYRVELFDASRSTGTVTLTAEVKEEAPATLTFKTRGLASITAANVHVTNNQQIHALERVDYDGTELTLHFHAPLSAGVAKVKIDWQALDGATPQLPTLDAFDANPKWQYKITSNCAALHCFDHGAVKSKRAGAWQSVGLCSTTFIPRVVPPAVIADLVAPAAIGSAGAQQANNPFVGGWLEPRLEVPKAHGAAPYCAQRRHLLSQRFPGETLVIPTGKLKVRNDDCNYEFRAGTNFYYLTGDTDPDGVLVLVPKEDGGHEATLYYHANMGRTTSDFYRDPENGELWVGPHMGLAQKRLYLDIDACAALSELPALLAKHQDARLLRDIDDRIDAQLPNATTERSQELAAFLSEQRLLKDPFELAALREACDATARGFNDVLRILPTSTRERAIEAAFNGRARLEGNGVGYSTIAASGTHACILHWSKNTGSFGPGDLLLLDAGVESNALYTADVTRTLPISGKFTPEQRAIYDLVYRAQAAGIAAAVPGAEFLDPHRAAMRVLCQGLVDLGILTGDVESLLTSRQYARYALHGTSHMLGLDVHDCSSARDEVYYYGTLKPGMVLTVEPGLYFQPDDGTVPERYRGIGVRIEDDILVTESGNEILSDLPRETNDVERWMAAIANPAAAASAAPAAPRDSH